MEPEQDLKTLYMGRYNLTSEQYGLLIDITDAIEIDRAFTEREIARLAKAIKRMAEAAA